MAMTLVSTVTVGSGGAATIEFTGIAGTGKDLLVVLSSRATSESYPIIQFNNDGTVANYTVRFLEGNGSNASSGTASSGFGGVLVSPISATTSNTFGNVAFYISNYAGSTAKSVSIDAVGEANATTAYQSIRAGSYSGTSAITSVKLYNNGDSLSQYSSASLYIIS
jgi:hypothetical protein